MRDAFGGVFMMRLMLVFIVIYVAFTAVSLNYAKAFKIKNKIIDVVEQKEITDIASFFNGGNGKNTEQFDNIISRANYTKQCNNGNGEIKNKDGAATGYCYRGIIIEKNEAKSTKDTIYYNIYTYADWNLGALNLLLALSGEQNHSEYVHGVWEITGEAIVKIK